jgi:hypothetical protein
MSEQQLNEQAILDGLFETVKNLPEEPVFIGRLNLRVTLRGLTTSKVDSIRERCTIRKTVKGQVTEKLDAEQFNATLINDATVELEVKGLKLEGWGDKRLTSHFKASGGEEVAKRMLLAGELDAVGDKVLEISGFGVSIEDVKN